MTVTTKHLFALPFFLASVLAWAGGIVPVRPFDANRYLGDWYEIGSIPQSFQKDCHCTKANYSFRDDGLIRVLNSCRDKSPSGRERRAEGKARFKEDAQQGYLEVSFFWIFWGDYVVTEMGENYDYAVVSNRKGSTLWVLARQPQMPSAQLSGILARAKEKGIRVGDFVDGTQTGCAW